MVENECKSDAFDVLNTYKDFLELKAIYEKLKNQLLRKTPSCLFPPIKCMIGFNPPSTETEQDFRKDVEVSLETLDIVFQRSEVLYRNLRATFRPKKKGNKKVFTAASIDFLCNYLRQTGSFNLHETFSIVSELFSVVTHKEVDAENVKKQYYDFQREQKPQPEVMVVRKIKVSKRHRRKT